MASRLPPGASRVFHRAIDGTIPYFRSEGGMQEEGRLSEGADPAELLAQGYVEAGRDDFLEARTRLDPMRPMPDRAMEANVHLPGGKVRMDTADAHAYADEVDTTYAARSAEDDALAELAGAMDYAGLGKPAPVPATRGTGNRPAPRGDSPADVDALGAAWDNFYGRAQKVDVGNVPSTVPLASRMGGEPLPGPSRGQTPTRTANSPVPVPDAEEGDTLNAAQRRSAIMRGAAGVGKGMSRIGAAIAGVRPEEGAAADMEQGAEAQVREYLQRKQQGEAEKASAEQAALKDPSSPASQRFQAMVSRAFGSVYTPEQIASMTAADAPLVGKYGEMVRTLEDRAAGRTAEAESQQAQIAARATEAEKQRAFEGKQGAANRANAREIAGMRQETRETPEEREQRRIEGERRKLSERNVGGYEIDPANPPTADGSKTMANVVASSRELNQSLDLLERMYAKQGSEKIGADAGTMASEWMNITNKLRMINDMGVPNGADYLMLGKQLEDPTTMSAITTSKARGLAQMKALRDQIRRKVDATAYAYKFKPVGGGAPSGAAAEAQPGRRKRDAQGRMWEEGPDGEMRMVL